MGGVGERDVQEERGKGIQRAMRAESEEKQKYGRHVLPKKLTKKRNEGECI